MADISCCDIKSTKLQSDQLIESASGLSVAVERCPLCSEAKKPFYCSKCVSNGEFIHSNATFPDRYQDSHMRWDRLKAERDRLLDRFKKETAHIHRRKEKMTALDVCRRNIELLKKSIAASKELAKQEQKIRETVRLENMRHFKRNKNHLDKKKRIVDYINKVTDTISKKQSMLGEKEQQLMKIRKQHIVDLTTFIFPVTEAKSKGDSIGLDGSDDVHLREALREASSTKYDRGRWIFSNSQYRVVTPVLPSHGEYTQFNIMVAKAAEDNAVATPSPTDPGNTIVAGLCYTSQLVALLSHFLSISLPKKQFFSEFCAPDLSEKKFTSAVSRLNQNILYLCFSQGVTTELIEPKHTLHNVVLLLTQPQLGRIGSFDIEQDMMDSVENSSGGQSDESDEVESYPPPLDLDAADWEKIPDTAETFVSQDMSQSALTASGVLTSAWNSLGSFFRK